MRRKWRILVVDDEEHVARTLKLSLDFTGKYEVRIENRGGRTLETAREFEPDLILLDVVMPDRRGEDVLIELRGDAALNRVPVLFLTATVPERRVRDVEPDQWIAKPVLAAEIVRQIDSHLAPRGTEGTCGSW